MDNGLARTLAPISRRIRLLAARAVIRLVADTLREQEVQVTLLRGEVGRAERYQHYGFSSHPHPGAEAIVIAIGGSRDHLVVVADGDRRYRPTDLAEGEVALYHSEGHRVVLKNGGLIHAECDTLRVTAATKVELLTPILEVTGEVLDRRATGGQSMHGMRTVYNDHTHDENADTVTDPPNQPMGGTP